MHLDCCLSAYCFAAWMGASGPEAAQGEPPSTQTTLMEKVASLPGSITDDNWYPGGSLICFPICSRSKIDVPFVPTRYPFTKQRFLFPVSSHAVPPAPPPSSRLCSFELVHLLLLNFAHLTPLFPPHTQPPTCTPTSCFDNCLPSFFVCVYFSFSFFFFFRIVLLLQICLCVRFYLQDSMRNRAGSV